MKLKFLNVVISIFIFTCMFSIILNNGHNVKASGADVSIVGEPSYILTKSIIRNNVLIGETFEINITLRNNGDAKSDELIVNLTDIEGFSLSRTTILEPSETKVVSFTWSTVTMKDQQILVSYYPSDPDIDCNKFNCGSTNFKIHITGNNGLPATSTPGFEIILIITAIIVLIFIYKKEK